MKMHS